MRFYAPFLLLVAGAQVNADLPGLLPGVDLGTVFNLLVNKTKCPFQCFIAAGNKIESCKGGVVNAFCKNLDNIRGASTKCLDDCGADGATIQFMDMFFDKIACLS